MIAADSEILQELRAGTLQEHRHGNLELKEGWSQGYGSKLSALANKTQNAAGWMVVGVTASGAAAGKNEAWAQQTEEVISQHINARLDPVQACRGIRCHDVGGAWIIVIEVANPGAVVNWDGHAYKASGTTEARMTPEEVMEMTIRLPGLSDYSKQPAQSQVIAGLTAEFVGVVAKHRAYDSSIQQLCSRTPDSVLSALQITGTQCERILFGPTKYRVVGIDSSGVPRVNESYSGLFGLLKPDFRDVIQEVGRHLSGGDAAFEPYSPAALKEALANAVAHAAYFERDGEVVVEVHPDRIAVSNLCLPESGAFANRWFSRAHRTVNVMLMETLRLAGIVDELGRGKSVIFRESLLGGRREPLVSIDPAGRFSRWTLAIYGGARDERLLRLVERLREIYGEERKALISLALILWSKKPLTDIRKHMDGESVILRDVLEHTKCPVFASEDRLLVSRWVTVLLGEGKDSKKLSQQEEQHLYELASKLSRQYHNGTMTTAQFREWADMGDTPSERTLASATLTGWQKRGLVERVGKGQYRFKSAAPEEQAAQERAADRIRKILEALGTNGQA